MANVENWLVPSVMFLATAAPFCLHFWLHFRHRTEVQKTIRVAIERGQDLSPEMLAAFGQSTRSKSADLRRGVISVALGVGSIIIGLMFDDPDLKQGMFLLAVLPVVLGITYLGLWKFAPRG